METAFAVVLFVLLYVFVLFPSLMMAVGCLRPRRRVSGRYTPSVDILIAARNEEAHITAKLHNTLAATYPADRLRILVGSDGSTDGTHAAVRAFDSEQVQLVALPAGTGKTATINRLARDAAAEVLIVSDADVLIDPAAITRLAAHFEDPAVGAVCARRADKTAASAHVGRQARLYNLYEGAIKRGEGRIGRVLGGNGSLYAVRRALFDELPAGAPDDFVSILRVLAKNKKVLYEEDAVSREDLPRSARREFVRRRRTTARAIRGLWDVRTLLNPLRFPLASVLLLSHKVLRWGAGLLLLALLALNAALAGRPPYGTWLAAQALFYAGALLGRLPLGGCVWKPFTMVRYFVLMNLAATAGILDVLRRRNWNSWDVAASR